MGWPDVVIAVLGMAFGFICGLVTIKRSARWCPVCGGGLRCTDCGSNEYTRYAASSHGSRRTT
jgi:hypothetical protein